MTKTEEVKKFIETKNQLGVTVSDIGSWQRFFRKITTPATPRFDYIYSFALYDGILQVGDGYGPGAKGSFEGIIDNQTGAVYYASWNLSRLFEDASEDERPAFVKYEDITASINAAIVAKYDEMAKSETDDREPDENESYTVANDAGHYYFYNEGQCPYKRTPGTKRVRATELVLQYIQDPAGTIQRIIDAEPDARAAVKYNLMMRRLFDAEQSRIKTAPEFASLRTAKQIAQTIPVNADRVAFVYEMSNGQQVAGKIDADALRRIPCYCCGVYTYSSWDADKATRETIRRTDGNGADIQLGRIVELSYCKKTLYTREGGNQ